MARSRKRDRVQAVEVEHREVGVRHAEAAVPARRECVEERRACCPKCHSTRRRVERSALGEDGGRMLYVRCRGCAHRYIVWNPQY